jgi:fluoroacetyl-CoA thioesterase
VSGAPTDETPAMRPGPPRGATATLEVTVTPEMTARVDGQEIHPVYGTGALVAHIEQVCRELLIPHLEPGQEGVGASIDVHHRAPVPVGETVVLVATVATVGPTKLVCEVLARHAGTMIARGSFEQRVVDVDVFQGEIEARRSAGQRSSAASAATGRTVPDASAGASSGSVAGSAASA